LLPLAQLAGVPAAVVIGAVAVLLEVRFVVLVLVAQQVVQRETVVRSHEVHARRRLAGGGFEQVARSGQARSQRADQAGVAAPPGARRVAILVVPLRPARRKTAQAIAVRPEIPGLGDQLYLRERRILLDRGEKRAVARQRDRQVEA